MAALGVADQDIQTTNYSVYTQREPGPDGKDGLGPTTYHVSAATGLGGGGAPIQPGELEVNTSIQVTFAVRTQNVKRKSICPHASRFTHLARSPYRNACPGKRC